MGYTQYWYRPKVIPKRTYDAIVRDFKKILPALDKEGMRLQYEYNLSHLIELTKTNVRFNGVAVVGHETFEFPRVYSGNKDVVFNFTKTAQKPYDLAVTSFLLIAKHYLGDDIVVYSDSSDKDWGEARKLVQKQLGYGKDFRFDTEGALVCPSCKKELLKSGHTTEME
jgi:hypothetical protein